MNKLQLFRIVGESYAKVNDSDIIGTDDIAMRFFKETAEQMYPDNLHRREWALSNMEMFYTQESERITIMKKLRGESKSQDILDMIRARQVYRES